MLVSWFSWKIFSTRSPCIESGVELADDGLLLLVCIALSAIDVAGPQPNNVKNSKDLEKTPG